MFKIRTMIFSSSVSTENPSLLDFEDLFGGLEGRGCYCQSPAHFLSDLNHLPPGTSYCRCLKRHLWKVNSVPSLTHYLQSNLCLKSHLTPTLGIPDLNQTSFYYPWSIKKNFWLHPLNWYFMYFHCLVAPC